MRFLPTFSRKTFLVALIVVLVAIAYYAESSAAQLTITWTDNSDNEDRFEIERKLGLTGTFSLIATVGANITSYTDSGLADETTYYCYRVRASNGYGDSAYSNEDCAMAALAFQTITVSTAGSGSGTVTSIPGGISCGADCTEDYDSGSVVTLTATPATGSVFTGWSDAGCSGTGTCTVTMDSDTTVTATFNLQVISLTVTKAGSGDGTVTSFPTGINCGTDCIERYSSGRTVTLTATQGVGSTFVGLSGGGCNGANTCMLTINGAISVTSTFSKTYTDDPLTSQVTLVKAQHITEALEAINTLRGRNGLGSINFTAPIPATGVTIRANHITTLQTGLNAVYDVSGRTRPTFDTIVTRTTVIGKRQMDQIRNAIRVLE